MSWVFGGCAKEMRTKSEVTAAKLAEVAFAALPDEVDDELMVLARGGCVRESLLALTSGLALPYVCGSRFFVQRAAVSNVSACEKGKKGGIACATGAPLAQQERCLRNRSAAYATRAPCLHALRGYRLRIKTSFAHWGAVCAPGCNRVEISDLFSQVSSGLYRWMCARMSFLGVCDIDNQHIERKCSANEPQVLIQT